MSKFSSPAWIMTAFFSGIFFVSNCGGGGDYANPAIGVNATRGLPAFTDEVNALRQRVTELEARLSAVSDHRTTLTISGRNVQIVSGSGATDDNGALTGLGNLIIGITRALRRLPEPDHTILSAETMTIRAMADWSLGVITR